MRLRKSVAAAFAALLCGTYIVASDPGTASAQPVPEFGFASLSTLANTSNTDHYAYAAQAKNIGASWVRLVVPWNNIEANRGTYDWATIDPAVLAAKAYGTKVLLLLTGPAPFWAQPLPGDPFSRAATPADPATFGAFAAAAANHYKDYVSTWEIWNEPNDPTYFQSPSVPNYIQLLRAAYQSIHAVQPSAVVVTGGVTSAPFAISETGFIDQLYSNGARPYLDGIGMHPYTVPYGISDDPKHVWNDLAIARATMVNYGDAAKKIWVTEWGLPTGTSGSASTEEQQASRLVEALQRAAATPYLAPLFIFTVRDWSTDTTNPDANYGVFHYDGSPKQAAWAILRYSSGSSGPPPTTTPPTTTPPPTTPPPTTPPPTTPPPTTPPPTTPPPTTPPPSPPAQNLVWVLGRLLGWW